MFPEAGPVTHALFDNDGTISVLLQGWEVIMESVMIRSILGSAENTSDERLLQRVRERVKEYIDITTGVQTLVQMHGLVELVKEFGLVPAGDVKDAHGYKSLYAAAIGRTALTPWGRTWRASAESGEPPVDNPAYYLRYCKSFARMGGTLRYLKADNRDFFLSLLQTLPLS